MDETTRLKREIEALQMRAQAYKWLAIFLSVVLLALLLALPLLMGGGS